MIDELLNTLRALKSDPGRAVELYGQLYRESLFALVKAGSETNLQSCLFLHYPSADGIRELPLFTKPEFVLPGMPHWATRTGVLTNEQNESQG
jgi:hypothetical protein